MPAVDEPRAATDTQRLFFALWPDDSVRLRLQQLAVQHAQGNGRVVPAANLHLTLVFIGGVSAGQRDCLHAAAVSVLAAPFCVTLDRLGFWPRPRVLWAGAGSTPDALTDLVTRLAAALADCGYQAEARPYRAHVTLARKARRPPAVACIEPLLWQARDFCLVESVSGEQGSEYRVLARWPLRG